MGKSRSHFKRTEMRTKQHLKHKLRKQVGGRSRKGNQADDDDRNQSGATMAEIVEDVKQGSAIASRDFDLDARALADLLARPQEGTGSKKKLSTQALPEDDPAALPAVPILSEEEKFLREQANAPATSGKNQYKKQGQSYVFWDNSGLAKPIVDALRDLKFTHPTPVQQESIPYAITEGAGNDIVVSAETGSGKTLVFALPIIQDILKNRKDKLVPWKHEVGKKTKRDARDIGNRVDDDDEEGEAFEEDEEMDEETLAAIAAEEEELEEVEDDNEEEELEEGEEGDEEFEEEDEEEEGEDEYEEVDLDEEVEELADDEDGDDDDVDFEALAKDGWTSGPSTTTAPTVSAFKRGSKKGAAAAPVAEPPKRSQNVMHTLIVTPTRELALQIKQTMEDLTRHCGVTVGCIVGGMSPAKQQRVLNRCPDVLICTPGRVWELVQKNEGAYLGHSISKRLKYVVLDEADKLLQSGRFEELKNILDRIHADVLPTGVMTDDEIAAGEGGLTAGTWDEEKRQFVPNAEQAPKKYGRDEVRPMQMPPAPPKGHRVATFVTSATLSLAVNYERKDVKKKQIIRTSNANTLRSVIHELGIKMKTYKLFDLAPEHGLVAKINETYLRCPEDSKEVNLYYFLRTFKDKCVVFVNAVSMLRRLTKLLEVLGLPVVGLHASMQQRQRLKFIDRFKNGDKRVLIATDIASRGLDIDGLKYVVHYQVPRSTDSYIHRCGRTARCGGTGLSLMLVGPSEYVSFKKLTASMQRKTPMETFGVDPSSVHQLSSHLKVANQIDKLQLEIDKKSAQQRWITSSAEDAGIDADDMVDKEAAQVSREKMKAIKVLKKKLDAMVRKDVGSGGKGAYRTAARTMGIQQASERFHDRAKRQTFNGK